MLAGVRITVTAESHSLRCDWKSTQASRLAVENFNQACCVSSALPSLWPAVPACLFWALEETRPRAKKMRPGSNFRTGNFDENIPKFKTIGKEWDVVARPHRQNLDFLSLTNGWNPG